MATTSFRNTHFNPSAQIEDDLAREMAQLKICDERKKKEIARICSASNELKELQNKIMQAYQNKERAAQISEKQYRQQVNLVRKNFSINFEMIGTRYANWSNHVEN